MGAALLSYLISAANRRADVSGRWMFNGEQVKVKRVYSPEELRQQAGREKTEVTRRSREVVIKPLSRAVKWVSQPMRSGSGWKHGNSRRSGQSG